jgi:hypothetical protein
MKLRKLKAMVPMAAMALIGCSVINSKEQDVDLSQEFKDYWYAGKAELTRYNLEQARYGEIHQGNAVLIFVTEDFLTDKQVKYESNGPDHNTASVMKLNFTRNFLTGIYPYSMMSSIFSPVNHTQPTLKVTTSSQEWCGHTFSQLNFRNNHYEGHLYSYFQQEGDQEFSLDQAMLEDEAWTKIRLNPSALPTGDIELIPGTQFLRLGHRAFGVEKARAILESIQDPSLSEKPLNKYRIEYQEFHRVLEITFEQDFPYAIVAWEEEVQSGFDQPKTLTTRAVRTHVINTPYWTQHSVADTVLRKELGL